MHRSPSVRLVDPVPRASRNQPHLVRAGTQRLTSRWVYVLVTRRAGSRRGIRQYHWCPTVAIPRTEGGRGHRGSSPCRRLQGTVACERSAIEMTFVPSQSGCVQDPAGGRWLPLTALVIRPLVSTSGAALHTRAAPSKSQSNSVAVVGYFCRAQASTPCITLPPRVQPTRLERRTKALEPAQTGGGAHRRCGPYPIMDAHSAFIHPAQAPFRCSNALARIQFGLGPKVRPHSALASAGGTRDARVWDSQSSDAPVAQRKRGLREEV
jgi:hypothetical protein